jgi:hypothetical protein
VPQTVFVDAFFVLVDDSNRTLVQRVTQQQMDYWIAKHGEVNLPESLTLAGCPNFAERVRKHQLALG